MLRKRYQKADKSLIESDFQRIIREISWNTKVKQSAKQHITQHGGQRLELSRSEPTPAGVHVIPAA